MKRKWIVLTLLILVSFLMASAGSAAERKKTPVDKKTTQGEKKIVLTPDDLQWKDGPAAIPGSKSAVLEGSPEKGGYFAVRLKIPAGAKIAAHVHDDIERVTVISGKIYLAMGEKQQNPAVLPAGSYFSLPPKTVHNAWVEEETVLQIATNGPWTMRAVKGGMQRGK